ncbi:hypothetical protein TRP66_19540 [Pseudomonas sp. JDS28PS106]|uniref:hypothetical protein n=1 Tax=Pseudomonas sp. JDS28PS106 TaxID=2497235 RepID=UPI002FD4B66C
MNVMNVMPSLSLSPVGPVNDAGDEVHCRQGDLDGACGPYSLIMGLIAAGIIRKEEVGYGCLSDGRTRLGKFQNRLREFGGLITEGTDEFDLDWLHECFTRQISVSTVKGTTRQIVDSVVEAIDSNQSAIVGVDFTGGGGHWVLVVGYQGQQVTDEHGEARGATTHLLCLDPFLEAPRVSLWNAVLEVQTADGAVVNAGRYPTNHWGGIEQVKVRMSAGILIGRR